ncbi:MAG: hypothetical protein JO246_02360 [Frankiaceae bacterium]|nr:hypothetical protein [Frankiaceae bacterium]MBV9873048.1 hypothetical protein [Frankiaceae bacterium]
MRARPTGLLVVVTAAASLLGSAGTAHAGATSALVYDYSLAGVSTASVPNSAPAGPTTDLSLYGAWSAQPDSVTFSGDTSGHRSIGYALPTAGTHTLDAGPGQSVGFGARFVYRPPAGGTCFRDSPNLTQVGRFNDYAAQAKIQLSKCADSTKAVFAECRFAGSLTPGTVTPVMSTLPMIPGKTYLVKCQKTPDASGRAKVTLTVTKKDPIAGNQTRVDTFAVAATGAIRTTEALSVANKYPLPAAPNNTDQFVGNIHEATYCVGSTTDVTSCLAAYLPAS